VAAFGLAGIITNPRGSLTANGSAGVPLRRCSFARNRKVVAQELTPWSRR
jgi:hypothetical protein